MNVILPVAGKGERMRPYTNNLPKCLLPVGGKTIIDWIVADTLPLKASETIFINGYKAEVIDEFLTQRQEWGKMRTILQSDPQGLGQAISLALPYIEDDEPILIILGDTLFQADIQNLANANENILYTYKVKDPSRFGVAVTDAKQFFKGLPVTVTAEPQNGATWSQWSDGEKNIQRVIYFDKSANLTAIFK